MQSIRNAAIRHALTAAAAVVMLGSFAATSVSAAELTRAEVKAGVLAAQADGSLGSVGAGYGYDDHGRPLTAAGPATRAQVKAETVRALRDGSVNAYLGDSYAPGAPRKADRTL